MNQGPDHRPSRRLQWHTCAEWIRDDALVRAAYRAGVTEEEFIRILLKERAELMADLEKCLHHSTRPLMIERASQA